MTLVQKHKKFLNVLLICYIIFAGCFVFPIKAEGKASIDLIKLYLLVASYCAVGTLAGLVYGRKKGRVVYFLTLIFTMVGLVCRYLLEFGEVSNTYNFTAVNILTYLVIVPMGTLLAYIISVKKEEI